MAAKFELTIMQVPCIMAASMPGIIVSFAAKELSI
jgi:hypothetical protein